MLLYQGSPEDLFLFKLLFYLFYLHMDLCTTCMPGSARSAEVLELLELGVMDGCKLKVESGSGNRSQALWKSRAVSIFF